MNTISCLVVKELKKCILKFILLIPLIPPFVFTQSTEMESEGTSSTASCLSKDVSHICTWIHLKEKLVFTDCLNRWTFCCLTKDDVAGYVYWSMSMSCIRLPLCLHETSYLNSHDELTQHLYPISIWLHLRGSAIQHPVETTVGYLLWQRNTYITLPKIVICVLTSAI